MGILKLKRIKNELKNKSSAVRRATNRGDQVLISIIPILGRGRSSNYSCKTSKSNAFNFDKTMVNEIYNTCIIQCSNLNDKLQILLLAF
jgi:hypothetical protein